MGQCAPGRAELAHRRELAWFAVNSVSGTFALIPPIHPPKRKLCLVIIVLAQVVIAFFGYKLVHVF